MAKMIYDARQLPPYLSIQQTAAMLQITDDLARRQCRSGEFPAYKLGKKLWRVDKNALLELMSAQRANACT